MFWKIGPGVSRFYVFGWNENIKIPRQSAFQKTIPNSTPSKNIH